MRHSLILFALAGCQAGASVNEGGSEPPTTQPASQDSARPLPIVDVSAAPSGCGLQIRFGSYAMGIDRGAARTIVDLLARHPDVAELKRQHWGREGEYTLCAILRPGAGAAALSVAVERLIPAKPRGPIDVLVGDERMRQGR